MLIRITNTPRPYAWGSTTAIADLLGREPSGGPEAELWLGSHPGSPARIVEGAAEEDLAQWAAAHAPGGRLPFLLKVLAASAPLSLQVHPSAGQARAGFDRENALGIPVDAPDRNYRDENPKPELIVALSDPFRALCGFRPVAESRADLARLDDARLDPLLERLTGDVDLPATVRWMLERGDGSEQVTTAISDRARSAEGDDAGEWLITARILAAHHPGDPGVTISTLMHTMLLAPGDALFLPAGNLHAYIDGLGIELMTASDNVLRGGLTTKHIDVDELLEVVDFRPIPVPRLPVDRRAPGISIYRPEGPGFALLDVRPADLARSDGIELGPVSVALCLDGDVQIDGQALGRGDAALVDALRPRITGTGRVVLATTVGETARA